MYVHPVLPWNLKLQNLSLPRSEPDEQPNESSQLVESLELRKRARCAQSQPRFVACIGVVIYLTPSVIRARGLSCRSFLRRRTERRGIGGMDTANGKLKTGRGAGRGLRCRTACPTEIYLRMDTSTFALCVRLSNLYLSTPSPPHCGQHCRGWCGGRIIRNLAKNSFQQSPSQSGH